MKLPFLGPKSVGKVKVRTIENRVTCRKVALLLIFLQINIGKGKNSPSANSTTTAAVYVCVTQAPPPWILKRGGLESFGPGEKVPLFAWMKWTVSVSHTPN